MSTFAILGSHPALSLAELSTLDYQASMSSTQAAFFEVELAPNLIARLGGTQKLGEILFEREVDIDPEKLAVDLSDFLLAQKLSGKIKFGLSIYDLGNPSKTKALQKQSQRLGLEIKRHLKAQGQAARLVTSRDEQLSTVVVDKNKLTLQGAEFVLLPARDKILVGWTRAVQDYADWSHRDYDRPARNARRGMLPPKLARIMINLGLGKRAASDLSLLDPFCGAGTVLMEAAMLGVGKLVGSDIAASAVEDTRTNLDWLRGEGVRIPELELFTLDATQIETQIAPESIDLIVTEPLLGSPRRGQESRERVEQIVRELESLYAKALHALAITLKPDGLIVLALPEHQYQNRIIELNLEKILKSSSLKQIQQKKPLRYRREGQFVGRKLVILRSA